MSLKEGTWLGGRYRILRPLGSGSEGSVYLAIQENIYRFYAVKEMAKDGACFTARSLEIWKRLVHPGLAQVIDVLENEEFVFLVMDYIEGKNLRTLLEERRLPGERTVLFWGLQICDTLAYLHGQQPPIIFGDMKPENLILCGRRIILVDPGSAIMRNGGQKVTGTAGYFPPWKEEADEECDIYALGRTMEELLGGFGVSAGKTGDKTNRVHQTEQAASVGTGEIIRKCLSREEPRFRRIAECQRTIRRQMRRRRRLLISFVLAICAMAAAAGIVVVEELRQDRMTTYEQMLYAAREMSGREKTELLTEAVKLQPQQAEGYLKLLEEYVSDGRWTENEANRMEAMLREEWRNSGLSCEQYLQKNSEKYAELAYELGIAYWYFYVGNGGEKLAVPWFQKVLEYSKEGEAEARAARSRIYREIGSYRAQLMQGSQTGEAVSFDIYWQDLCALLESEAVKTENAVTTLAFLREMISQLTYYTLEFRYAGVGREQMAGVRDEILQKAEAMEEQNAVIRRQKEEIAKLRVLLDEAMERTYERGE
ncbi:MAG: serine/threonine-protein kinase [Eubacteriales bacterium]|nr:serine/threonine-protein kinase [Eubacteriales bacterium]